MDGKEKSRSWFCVWNNPQIEYPDSEPHEIAETVLDIWVKEKPTRSGAVAYCISSENLIHLHMVLEDSNQARFSALKSLYPKAHLEPTKGTKEQAEDYINKRGRFTEKGEQVVYIARYGEIKGAQGQRKDLEIIQDWIEQGKTPREILSQDIRYRRYEKMIRGAYFDKRFQETPVVRDVKVFWHTGESGTGKTYSYSKYCNSFGQDNVYLFTDYDNGGLDFYSGEKYLFLDEFRGQMKFSTLLGLLQGYKQQFHARYTNVWGLWSEVHITSVLMPDEVYKNMVTDNCDTDVIEQLYRRINTIIYHSKDHNGYHKFEIPMSEYKGRKDLISRALGNNTGSDFIKVSDQETLPFN